VRGSPPATWPGCRRARGKRPGSRVARLRVGAQAGAGPVPPHSAAGDRTVRERRRRRRDAGVRPPVGRARGAAQRRPLLRRTLLDRGDRAGRDADACRVAVGRQGDDRRWGAAGRAVRCLQQYDVTIPGGGGPTVGIVGLTLGGGSACSGASTGSPAITSSALGLCLPRDASSTVTQTARARNLSWVFASDLGSSHPIGVLRTPDAAVNDQRVALNAHR
jgi:hypothetical protein